MKRLCVAAALLFFTGIFLLSWNRPAGAETLLERGTYLMKGIVACGNCHTPGSLEGKPDHSRDLAGGTKWDEKPFTVYAANLTPDKETGLGNWTDAEIIRAIREGKSRDGRTLGPPMPFELYRRMSDRDVRAIVAYLRTRKPVRSKVPAPVYRIPLPPAYGPPVKSVPEVSRADKVKYGEYLAGPLGHCIECHTPFAGPGRRDFKNRLGAGGFHLVGGFGENHSANITPDKETGIGTWTDRQIKVAVKLGQRANGAPMGPPMGYSYYQNIKDADMNAIIAYLRSLKPVRNEVKVRYIPPKKK